MSVPITHIPIMQKLILDLFEYMNVLKCEGHVPLDTCEWKDTLLRYPTGPHGAREDDPDILLNEFNNVVKLANDSFPKYEFSLKTEFSDDHSKCSTPFKYWLKYSLKAENQE